MRITYEVLCAGELLMSFSADLSQAASPITIEYPRRLQTPFQTADAKHSSEEAARIVNEWLFSEGGACWDKKQRVKVKPGVKIEKNTHVTGWHMGKHGLWYGSIDQRPAR